MRHPFPATWTFPSAILCCLLCAIHLAASPAESLRIEPGQTHPKSITSFGGSIEIRGKIEESVYLIGGRLVVSGEIGQDVICIGSTVEIMENALIRKDLIVIGGKLNKSEKSKINGEFFYIRTRDDLKKMAQTLLPFLPGGADISFFKIIKIVFWLILSLVMLAIFPVKITEACDLLERAPGRVSVIGIASMILFVFLLLAFVLLSLILIGIPLLLILIVGYFAALVFGRAVVFYFLGRKIADSLNRKNINPPVFLLIGVLVYGIFKFIPFVGVLFLVLLDIFVIGISVGYFFRRKLFA